MELFRPILPSPRYLVENEILADADGYPLLDRQLFLLDTKLPEETIKERYPALYAYLEKGKVDSVHERYLCRNRTPWYSQENRPSAPIVCTYLGRSNTKSEQLLGESRVYGGGLHKLEPNELANVDALQIAELVPDFKLDLGAVQLGLF